MNWYTQWLKNAHDNPLDQDAITIYKTILNILLTKWDDWKASDNKLISFPLVDLSPLKLNTTQKYDNIPLKLCLSIIKSEGPLPYDHFYLHRKLVTEEWTEEGIDAESKSEIDVIDILLHFTESFSKNDIDRLSHILTFAIRQELKAFDTYTFNVKNNNITIMSAVELVDKIRCVSDNIVSDYELMAYVCSKMGVAKMSKKPFEAIIRDFVFEEFNKYYSISDRKHFMGSFEIMDIEMMEHMTIDKLMNAAKERYPNTKNMTL